MIHKPPLTTNPNCIVMEAKTPLPFLFNDHQSADEIKYKLMCLNLELQSAKSQAYEEMRKNRETIRQLTQLLKDVCRERDEARDKLQVLLTLTKTDSNCLNKAISISNETSNFGLPKQPVPGSYCIGTPVKMSVPDLELAILDKLVKSKPLPEKGRLVQAVREAGPLLQTLLIGPVPGWRNPPPLQLLESPGLGLMNKRPSDGESSSSSHLEVPRGFSQIPSSSVLNFGRASSSCLNGGHSLSDDVNGRFREYHVATGKRMIQ